MNLCKLRLLFLGAAALVCSPAILAQQSINSATLSGRVNDPSGALVAVARVEARNIATNQTTKTETDTGGRFRFAYLPVGPYLITAVKPGFAEVHSSVDLTIGAAFDLALTLSVSDTKQNVEITSEAPLIETVRTQTSETIRPDEIENLPLNGRNYLDLALLAPGVSRTNASRTSQYLTTSAVPGTTISISGQRNLGTSFIVDGLSSNDDSTELSSTFYSQEVVREFQVITSGATAEFGRASSGIVNVLTRSGTNQFHGDAYGFLRNQRFDARNALSVKKIPLTRTQYGASLGGPIVRDRTFFFPTSNRRAKLPPASSRSAPQTSLQLMRASMRWICRLRGSSPESTPPGSKQQIIWRALIMSSPLGNVLPFASTCTASIAQMHSRSEV